MKPTIRNLRSAALIVIGILIGVAGYLAVSGDVLGLHESGGAEVRLLVREHDSGTIEVAAEQRLGDGEWSDRILPQFRFLSTEREPGTWYRSSPVTVQENSEETYCVISHGHPSDFFWSSAEEQALAWGEHRRNQVQYYAEHDPEAQARRIDQCVADGVDAIVTTLPAPDVLRPAIERALAARVVVTTFNSGANDFARVGSFLHASVDEFGVGRDAAEQLELAGLTGAVLCVIHEDQNVGLDERCDGLEQTYGGASVERFSVANTGTADLEGTARAIGAELDAGDYAAVFTLNQQIAIAAANAAPEGVVVATVDWDPMVLQAIVEGRVLFSVGTLSRQQIVGALDGAATVLDRYISLRDGFGLDAIRAVFTPTRMVFGTVTVTPEIVRGMRQALSAQGSN